MIPGLLHLAMDPWAITSRLRPPRLRLIKSINLRTRIKGGNHSSFSFDLVVKLDRINPQLFPLIKVLQQWQTLPFITLLGPCFDFNFIFLIWQSFIRDKIHFTFATSTLHYITMKNILRSRKLIAHDVCSSSPNDQLTKIFEM